MRIDWEKATRQVSAMAQGEMMRILVTGGAGYVGSHVLDALLTRNHRVLVVDDLSTGRLANIQHLLGQEGFSFFEDTILNAPLVDELTRQVDQVFHLAAVVGVKNVVDDPGRCIRVNAGGTEVVLEAAFRHGKRAVVVSSSEVYGKSTDLPLSEDGDCLLGPTTVRRWSYALAKAIDEQLALDYGRKGLPVCVLRYFNSYGPRLDARGYGSVVARFIDQALRDEPLTVYGDGRQSRCFTYVDDTVRATIMAGDLDAAVGGVFNIGADRETSVLELAEIIRDLTDSRSEIVHVPFRSVFGEKFEDISRRVPDTRRAAEALGFRVRVSLEEGLRRTIDWFRDAFPSGSSGREQS